jgi:hypothetical protein
MEVVDRNAAGRDCRLGLEGYAAAVRMVVCLNHCHPAVAMTNSDRVRHGVTDLRNFHELVLCSWISVGILPRESVGIFNGDTR